jgi:hypothetical protein
VAQCGAGRGTGQSRGLRGKSLGTRLALGASRQGVLPAAASWWTAERLGEGGTAGRASLSVASYRQAPACFEVMESRKSCRGMAVSLGRRARRERPGGRRGAAA